jgi:hypothetical protein
MGATSSRFLTAVLVLLVIAMARPARADVALKAATLRLPGATLQQLDLAVQAHPGGGLQLRIDAAKVDVPAMGWRHVGLHASGVLQRDQQLRWVFAGPVALDHASGGALGDAQMDLQVDPIANTLLVEFRQGPAQAGVAMPLDQPTHAQIELKNLPAAWLQGLLGTVWSGHPTGGKLDADIALDLRDSGLQAGGQFALGGVGFDTPAGTLAGKSLNGNGRLGIDTTDGGTHITLDSTLHGGELLLGPLYAKLPAHAVLLELDAIVKGGAVALDRLHVADPDALLLDGALAFDSRGQWQKIDLEHVLATFPAAYERYGKAWLSTLGLRDMATRGQLSASLDLRPDGPHAFAFDTSGMDIADADGRLAVDHLHGGINWSAQGTQPMTELGWRSLSLYRLAHGAGLSKWQSRAGALSLQRPLAVPLLGGQVQLSALNWHPAAAKGERLATSLAVTGVDMTAFSKAMGWPSFPGTVGGAIAGLRLIGDRIELQGGLSVNVFGGFVDITGLSLEQPFSSSPVLTGNLDMNQLDLGAITSVFDFGGISGPLDGSVHGLRLVDWEPVAFDARLLAGRGGRISQRAVNNLTTVGGGGMAAGLQGAVLRLFKTFGYRRIGLNCGLQGSVCHMSGLEPLSDGYTILEGSGLPHLRVVGHQNDVDWPTLVRRLKAATEGAAPEIR